MRPLLSLPLSLLACLGALACNNPPMNPPDHPALAAPVQAPQATRGQVAQVDAPTFQRLLEQKGGILLDVRTPGEVARGRLPDATVLDINGEGFERKLALLQKDKPFFVYCASGGRSSAAAELMIQKGFSEVYNLEGGIGAWMRAGLPVDRSAAVQTPQGEGAMTPTQLDALLGSDKRVLVAYQTPWCTPCRKMAPIIATLKQTWEAKARIVQVDVDQSEALVQRERIQGVPVFVVYVNGKERWRKSGEMPLEVLQAELARP